MSDYARFLADKAQIGTRDGFKPVWMPDFLFDFQAAMTDWAIWQGRSAILEDCGLGKTIQEFVFGENVVRHTNGRVLLVTGLAVAFQMQREAEKFGVKVTVSRDGKAHPGITITNYERLHLFNAADFVGMICDESSRIKNFGGRQRALVTDFMRKMRYRQPALATVMHMLIWM